MFEPNVILVPVITVMVIVLVICKQTRKFVCGVAAAALLIVIACALQDAARAEGISLPDGFYYRAVFIDEIEDDDVEDIVHVDDLDKLWDFYEDHSDIKFACNEELDEFAKSFVKTKGLWFAKEIINPAIEGRIVVLTMWEANPDNAIDDEIVDVYYSKFITDVR